MSPTAESPIPGLPRLFRLTARFRHARAFHPRGVAMNATWSPTQQIAPLADSPLLAGPRPALFRLSHGVGLPPSFPDLVGVAVKVLDVYGPGQDQDLLFTSSGHGFVGRHLLQPRRDLRDMQVSTLFPYQIRGIGRRALIARALPVSSSVRYAEVERDPSLCPGFEIRLTRGDGPLLATVDPADPLPDELGEALRFDPWRTGAELRPVGWWNSVRRPTYAASQEGRGAPPSHRRAVPAPDSPSA